jgi:hypothetical protein
MLNKQKVAAFIEQSVEWLIENQEGCCKYQLDDHLAIFVGWSAGYGKEKRNDIIQAKDDPDWGINAGVKVWTSDYMQTDYDWLNFPYYKDGDVWDMGWDIKPNEDYERVAKYLLDEYKQAKELDMTDGGMILPREVEYDVVCFERTLKIKFSKGSNINKGRILELLDKLYDEWQDDDDPDMCLEEYMVESICEICGLVVEEWDSIPYGEDYEPRETLWVCEHCLMGIESREGNQATLAHGVDEMDAVDSRCGWCHECGFDTLYELV